MSATALPFVSDPSSRKKTPDDALIVLSIDPEAIKFPVGSNLAAKISPECPESSIKGACNPLVRGAYVTQSETRHAREDACKNAGSPRKMKHTVWMSAPLPDAPGRVRARLVPTFWRFTTSCLSFGSSEAGRFSDMVVNGEGSDIAATEQLAVWGGRERRACKLVMF